MSNRNRIPRPCRWQVRYYLANLLLAEVDVEAVNRKFAVYLAREHVRTHRLDRYLAADKETVSKIHDRWGAQ